MQAGDNFIYEGINCILVRIYPDGYCDYLRQGEMVTVECKKINRCVFRKSPTKPLRKGLN